MTEILPKHKSFQNTPKTYKMTEIPPKPKNDQNTLEKKKKNPKP